MVKNTGLGKGLDALFSNSSVLKEINKDKNKEEKVEYIELVNIEPNPSQARKKFSEESINELATSIKNYGILQPIIVENKGKYYQIIAGERRWRAAKIAGLDKIPCLVRNESEQTAKEISLIENIQRENLNPIEKALGYKELIENYNLKQAELADKLGISRTYVTNTLRILNLDLRVLELALEGKLTEGHCKTLVSIEDPEQQYQLALKIIESGGTVKDLERTLKNKKKAPKKVAKNEAIYRDIEDSFTHFFGTKCQLKAGPRSGSIVIKYSSNEELERILDMIK